MGKRRKQRVPGKSLDRQRADFDIDSFRDESRGKVILKDADFKRIKQLMVDVSRINDLRKLQERLVIWNVNEFMICERPTQVSFFRIVNTQYEWSIRFLHLVEMIEERNRYLTQVNILMVLAWDKFHTLSKKQKDSGLT